MRVLTGVLLVLLAALHQSACADNRRDDPRTRLGRALLLRAKLAGIIGRNDDVTAEDNDTSGEDQEQMMKEDAAEDIFVGSQSDQHGASKATKDEGEDSETEGNEDEKTENDNEEDEAEKPEEAKDASGEQPGTEKNADGSSGDGGQGGDDDEDKDDGSASGADDDEDDDEEASGTEDGSADKTEQGAQNEATENDASATSEQPLTSESGNTEDAETRSAVQTSGSGAEDEATGNEEADSSGSDEQHSQEEANTSQDEDASGSDSEASNNQTSVVLAGPSKEASEDLPSARRSDIEISSGRNAEDDDEASAAIIQKGVESLSRLLSPVASGFDFTLYSGSAVESETEDKDSESEGEDESGQGSEDLPEVKVRQCKQVCGPPMSFHECAIPRCDLKMGTIKDLCFWLCEHQKDVCRQECE